MERQRNLWLLICLVLLVIDLTSGDCVGECDHNKDCVDSKACIHKKCLDPCEFEECGLNTICKTEKHVARCLCLLGLTGDPKVKCNEGCSSNDDCWEQLKCVDNSCQYPCYGNACGIAAFCEANDHEANCTCPGGYTGDPLVECKKVCTQDNDCLYSQACINNQCDDPCKNNDCGLNAICITEFHRAMCTCPDGLVGDPMLRCDKVCTRDNECFRTQRCIEGSCQYLCYFDVCGIGAVCETREQEEKCKCPAGHTGDPEVQCFPICKDNSDCRDDQVCEDEKCQDPCHGDNNPCGLCADCEVKEREANCVCPKGYNGDDAKDVCYRNCFFNLECEDWEACINGECRDPCENKDCGDKGYCNVYLHIATCAGIGGIEEPLKNLLKI